MTDIVGFILAIIITSGFSSLPIIVVLRPYKKSYYNTDMRTYYNKHYFEQLVKQSGVKNSPEYSPMTAPTIDNEQLPSTGHWEDW